MTTIASAGAVASGATVRVLHAYSADLLVALCGHRREPTSDSGPVDAPHCRLCEHILREFS